MMIACGFCLAGPTLLVLPLLLVWFGVFLVWCGWVGKYDPALRPTRRRWIVGALVAGPVGAIVSIELWTLGLLAWTIAVVRRIGRLKAGPALPVEAEAGVEAEAVEPAMNPGALRFHVQILLVLGCGLVAKTMLALAGAGLNLGL